MRGAWKRESDRRFLEHLDELGDHAEAPVLVLRWSMGALGRLARLASPAVALFNLLPPGIRVDGDLIGIDVAEVLRSRGFGELVPYLARLRVSTESGRVIVGFEVRETA